MTVDLDTIAGVNILAFNLIIIREKFSQKQLLGKSFQLPKAAKVRAKKSFPRRKNLGKSFPSQRQCQTPAAFQFRQCGRDYPYFFPSSTDSSLKAIKQKVSHNRIQGKSKSVPYASVLEAIQKKSTIFIPHPLPSDTNSFTNQ